MPPLARCTCPTLRLAPALLALVACGGGDGSLGPPLIGTPSFGSAQGRTLEVLLVTVPDHGGAAAVPLTVEWATAGAAPVANTGLAAARDTLALLVPEVPAGMYTVAVRQGTATLAEGDVVHLGPATAADPLATVTAALDDLEGFLQRASDAVWFGALPGDLGALVQGALAEATAARAALAAASAADVAALAPSLEANAALFAALRAGLAAPASRLCATQADTEALLALATTDTRGASVSAGYVLVEGLAGAPSPLAAAFTVALDHTTAVRALELLQSTLAAPLVMLPAPFVDCLGVAPAQPVTVGTPFVVALTGDARGPEAADAAGPNAALTAALGIVADARARTGDLLAAFGLRRGLAAGLLPAVPALPGAAAVGRLAADPIHVDWLVAEDPLGGDVPVTFARLAEDRLQVTLAGGQPGASVRVTFQYTQAGVGAASQRQLSVAIADPAVPLPPLVHIPPGVFTMGSPGTPGGPFDPGAPAVGPIHDVTLTQPFWVGALEVTQAEYTAFGAANPSSSVGAALPVEGVTWDEARAYCVALTVYQRAAGNVPAGYEYRLPTEAEWEYVCRAGTTTEFHFGPALACSAARFRVVGEGGFCPEVGVAPVGTYAPSAWGLHDMHGNVLEWCLDSLAPYPAQMVVDPFVTGGPVRVLRGGGWRSRDVDCTSAVRVGLAPGERQADLGFRVVLGPERAP